MLFALTREDSVDLGLPIVATLTAITWCEFQRWLEFMVVNSEVKDVPSYVFDLMDAHGYGDVLRMERPGEEIGFMLARGPDEDRYEYLWGIGYARKDPSLPVIRTDVDQNVVSREEAAAALARHPEIHAWFERFFKAIGKPDELPPLKSG